MHIAPLNHLKYLYDEIGSWVRRSMYVDAMGEQKK